MDINLILPALAALSVILLLIQKLYIKLRAKFPIKQNCWFCNTDTSVPYNSSNCWYCPTCDQYNGFTTDGSYNRPLPEHYDEKLNRGSLYSRLTEKKRSPRPPTNGLCQFCNINLELKIKQLAQFVPLNKANYDEEVQLYSDQLERVYRLCPRCQAVLEKTIQKQETFVASQNKNSSFEYPKLQVKGRERHSAYYFLITALSAGLLLSAMPQEWKAHALDTYHPPDFMVQMWSLVEAYIPKSLLPSLLLLFGVVVQLFDCILMRDTISFVNLLLWSILLTLKRVAFEIGGLTTVVQVLASVILLTTSITDRKISKQRKNVATVKPIQFQRLEKKVKTTKENYCLSEEKYPDKPDSPQPHVSDPCPVKPVPTPSHESTLDDLGFGKLNVNSRRLTRSQTKHFQTKEFNSQDQSDLFKPKPFSLTPPKLQLEKLSEYQLPLTRSSSQSSGFVSLTQQRDLEDYQPPSPSLIADNMDSVSQFGEVRLAPYQSSLLSPNPFPQPFGMPFSNFHPYTIMHFTPPQFGKFHPYTSSICYEPSLNLTNQSLPNEVEGSRWYRYLKNVFSSLLVIFLVTSNIAVLWKVFGYEYFKLNS